MRFDGGCVNNPFRWCDDLSNNAPNVLTFVPKAFATTVLHMAVDTKVTSSGDDSVIRRRLPVAGEAGRRLVAS